MDQTNELWNYGFSATFVMRPFLQPIYIPLVDREMLLFRLKQ